MQSIQKRIRTLLWELAKTTTLVLISIMILSGWFVRRYLQKPIEILNKRIVTYVEGNYDSWQFRLPYVEFQTLENVLLEMGSAITHHMNALSQSEKKFRSYIENAPIGVFIADRNGNYLEANAAAISMTGYPEEVLLKKNLNDIIAREDRELARSHFQKMRNTGKASGELTYVNKSGDRRYWIVDAVKLSENSFLGFTNDITTRKRAEEALRQSEEKHRALVENLSEMIFILDTDGKIRLSSAAIARYLKPPEDPLGKSILSYTHTNDQDSVARALRTAHENPGKVETIYGIRGFEPAGTPVYWDDTFVYLPDTAGINGIVATFRDVTDRMISEQKQAQLKKQLQQTQKVEAIGTLAAGIAHDFNNILSSILGFAELAKMDLPEDFPDLIENITQIIKAGERARNLVQHILTFSRHSDIPKQPFRISPVIKEVLKFITASLPAAIEVRYHLNAAEDMVFGDITQIHQVIMNLCTNAAHAMESNGGILEIRLEKTVYEATVSADENAAGSVSPEPGPYLKITVSDTGDGIPPDKINRIFDPFFTTKPRGKGTGMGLSVVHGIVKEMGGEIFVRSQIGEGTQFDILLPVYMQETMAESGGGRPMIPKGRGTILLIDDEKEICYVYSRLLMKLGYNVIPFNNSLDALEQIETHNRAIDLVITDVDMPGMDGIAISRRIREKHPHLPILLCTGFAKGINPQLIQEIGIQAVLMKPVIHSELAEVVKRNIQSWDNRQVVDGIHPDS